MTSEEGGFDVSIRLRHHRYMMNAMVQSTFCDCKRRQRTEWSSVCLFTFCFVSSSYPLLHTHSICKVSCCFDIFAMASLEAWAPLRLKSDLSALLLFAFFMASSVFVYLVSGSATSDFFPQLKPWPIDLLFKLIAIPNLFVVLVYLLLPLHKKEMVMESKSHIENDVLNLEISMCLLMMKATWMHPTVCI